MQSGYVAFLDVLGFSALLTGAGSDGRLSAYQRCLSETLEETGDPLPEEAVHFDMTDGRASVAKPSEPDHQPPDVAVFSDSIILVSRDDSARALETLIRQCSRLMAAMFQVDIALRGAISFGQYTRARLSVGTFFAGRAIVDAYHFEQEQDWIGIMLAPSAVQQVPDLHKRCDLTSPAFEPHRPADHLALSDRQGWVVCLQQCPLIPFHQKYPPWDTNTYDGFAVMPTSGDLSPESVIKSLVASIEALRRLRSLAPNPEAQRKYDRTIQWLDQKQQLWATIAFWRTRLIDEEKLTG
jgi:hypothetical protein